MADSNICSVYVFDDDERMWIVAKSEEEAKGCLAEYIGCTLEQWEADYGEWVSVSQLPPDSTLTIVDWEFGKKTTMSAKQWVELTLEAPCLLASTLF